MAKTEKSNKRNIIRRIGDFAVGMFLDENGKPKSTVLLYSFCLALLFIVIYIAANILLLEPLENLFSFLPVWLRNLCEIIIPAGIGSVPCVAMVLFCKENRSLPTLAYLWLAGFLVICIVGMAFLSDWSEGPEEFFLFLYILAAPFLADILCGGIASYLVYRKKYEEEEKKKEQKKALSLRYM